MAPHRYDPAADETTGEIAQAAELRAVLDRTAHDEDSALIDEALGHLERDRGRPPVPDLGGLLPGTGDPRTALDVDELDH